jgi:hypothetical protein
MVMLAATVRPLLLGLSLLLFVTVDELLSYLASVSTRVFMVMVLLNLFLRPSLAAVPATVLFRVIVVMFILVFPLTSCCLFLLNKTPILHYTL